MTEMHFLSDLGVIEQAGCYLALKLASFYVLFDVVLTPGSNYIL